MCDLGQITTFPLDKPKPVDYITPSPQTRNITMKRHQILRVALLIGAIAYLIGWLYLPHGRVSRTFIAISVAQVFLFVQSFRIYLNEPNQKNRPIFSQFRAFLFELGLVLSSSPSSVRVLGFFQSSAYVGFYFQEYISLGLYYVLFATADRLSSLWTPFLREFKTWQKYSIAFAIVGAFYVLLQLPTLNDAKYLYRTSDIVEWKVVDNAASRSSRALNRQYNTDRRSKSRTSRAQFLEWN